MYTYSTYSYVFYHSQTWIKQSVKILILSVILFKNQAPQGSSGAFLPVCQIVALGQSYYPDQESDPVISDMVLLHY